MEKGDTDGRNDSPCMGLEDLVEELDDGCGHLEVETQVGKQCFHWCRETCGPEKLFTIERDSRFTYKNIPLCFAQLW